MCGPLCARGTVTACKEAAAATRFKMITLLCSNKNIFICLAVIVLYSGGRLLRGATVWVYPSHVSHCLLSLLEVVRQGLSSERSGCRSCLNLLL